MSQDTISLNLTSREVVGKQVRQLRRDGQVPAVIHDHGKPSVHVQGEFVAMVKTYQAAGKHHPVQLTADGKKYTAMIKDAAFEPKKHRLTHIVFNAVSANQKVDAEVPIHPQYDEGNEVSPAERNSLLVISNMDVVTVKALPNKLPDALYYNGEKLVEVGDHVTVADLIIPADVELEADPEQTIATVYEPSAIAAANDAAGGDAEPEDAKEVDSEHESNADPDAGEDEIRPGGKKEFEDKEQGRNPEKS
ncbi:MAG TPA: 50S ribosomal protein L25 [Candidatus Saccharimonadales bacterium]